MTLAPTAAPERGPSRKDSRGKTGGPLALATTTHSSIQGGMRSIPHEYTANTIAENLYSQVDSEGRQQLIFGEIIDHCKGEDAIPISEQHPPMAVNPGL